MTQKQFYGGIVESRVVLRSSTAAIPAGVFNLCKLETSDLRPFLPDTGHLPLRVRVDPQRSATAEYSQREMNGKHTRTHAHTLTAEWRRGRPCGSPPILHVPRWEHNKSQIRSVQGYVFWREWTRGKALLQCLIWFLMEGNICNGNLSLGAKGLSTVFALSRTERNWDWY